MPRKPKFCKEDIINTGLSLIREHGWKGLTPAALAEALKASTMPIYSHFSSMQELKEELIERAWQLVLQYVSVKKTDNIWVDQAYGYIKFAREEKNLFVCIHDGTMPELQQEYYKKFYGYLEQQLADYPPFKKLPPEVSRKIRFARGMLSHGLASMVNAGLSYLKEDDDQIIWLLQISSHSLYEGIKDNLDDDFCGPQVCGTEPKS